MNVTKTYQAIKLSPTGAALIEKMEDSQTVIERIKNSSQYPFSFSLDRAIKNNTKGENLFCLSFFDIFKRQFWKSISSINDSIPRDVTLYDSSNLAYFNPHPSLAHSPFFIF